MDSVTGWPARLAASARVPARSPGSVRRELRLDLTTTDTEPVLRAAARDVLTLLNGRTVVLTTAELTLATVGPLTPMITAITAHVAPGGSVDLDELVDHSARQGLRARVEELGSSTPALAPGSLLRGLLHDVPIAIMLHRAAAPPLAPADVPLPYTPPVDICAGYRSGSVLHRWTEAHGPRRLGVGPRATPLDEDERLGPLPTPTRGPGTATRRRWIDVVGSTATFRSAFRDSVIEQELAGTPETVVHEYVVEGSLSADLGTVERCDAHAIVLPAPDCPAAAASAQLLAGCPIGEIESLISSRFTGTTTCTHLNDALWSLGALPTLVAGLGRT